VSADGISLWVAQEGFAFVAEALAAVPGLILRTYKTVHHCKSVKHEARHGSKCCLAS